MINNHFRYPRDLLPGVPPLRTIDLQLGIAGGDWGAVSWIVFPGETWRIMMMADEMAIYFLVDDNLNG